MGELTRFLPSEAERWAMKSTIEGSLRVVNAEAIECPECKAVALVQVWSCGCQHASYQVAHLYRPEAKRDPTSLPSTCQRFDFATLDRRCVLHINQDDCGPPDGIRATLMPSPRRVRTAEQK